MTDTHQKEPARAPLPPHELAYRPSAAIQMSDGAGLVDIAAHGSFDGKQLPLNIPGELAHSRRFVPSLRTHGHQEHGSVVLKLFLLGLLAVGAYGGFYGYCRYITSEKIKAFSDEASDLHHALMRLGKPASTEDIKMTVLKMATKVQIEVDPSTLQVSIEPLNAVTMVKLPSTAQMGLNLAASIPGNKQHLWVVGFKGRFISRYKVARRTFEAERYTWLQEDRP